MIDPSKAAVASDAIRIDNFRLHAGGMSSTSAYMIRPESKARPRAGVLFFHAYAPHAAEASRLQFMGEAVELAPRGVCSLAIQGVMPWEVEPSGPIPDRQQILDQVATLRLGIDTLLSEGVDLGRLAVVGHDFGGMYGCLLAALDRRPSAYVILAAVPRFGDWFAEFWQTGHTVESYNEAMSDLDPITNISHAAPAHVLFQFAKEDPFVTAAAAEEFYEASSSPREIRWYDAPHEAFGRDARDDRMAWLGKRLNL